MCRHIEGESVVIPAIQMEKAWCVQPYKRRWRERKRGEYSHIEGEKA
jgi:hypothetical protein